MVFLKKITTTRNFRSTVLQSISIYLRLFHSWRFWRSNAIDTRILYDLKAVLLDNRTFYKQLVESTKIGTVILQSDAIWLRSGRCPDI